MGELRSHIAGNAGCQLGQGDTKHSTGEKGGSGLIMDPSERMPTPRYVGVLSWWWSRATQTEPRQLGTAEFTTRTPGRVGPNRRPTR